MFTKQIKYANDPVDIDEWYWWDVISQYEITTTEIRPTSGQIPIDWFGVTMRLVITKKALFSCKKKREIQMISILI